MNEEEDRYARHRLIDWWDQERLLEARVMVVGAGAIGNEVIKLLALIGVGHLFIVDFDRIERSNLTRSVLFRDQDLGKGKAEIAALRARELNPDIDVRFLDGDLEFDLGLGVIREMDIVIGCLDQVGARLTLNRACLRIGIPWLNSGIETSYAEIALYGGVEAACFECAMTDGLWERQAERFSCTGLRADVPENKIPTTAVVASVTAGYVVNEALFYLNRSSSEEKTGLGCGQKLYLTFQPYGLYVIDLAYSPRCLAHERWQPIEVVERDVSDLTAAELLTSLGVPEGELEIGFDLLLRMQCVRCGQEETLLKPLGQCGASLSHCPNCEAETRRPDAIHRLSTDSAYANFPLARLCIPDYQILAVKYREHRRYIQLTGRFRR